MEFGRYTGNVDGQAGSLITALDAILVTGEGWGKEFSGTNKAVYRPPSGNRLRLRVQDDGPGSHGGREARITGYETMSDVDTGTNPFPTAAQGVGGNAMVVARKSNTANATTRPYIAFADERAVYFFCLTGDVANSYFTWAFGEIFSVAPGDQWNTVIIGRTLETNTTGTHDQLQNCHTTGMNTTVNGHFMARAYNGLPTTDGAIPFGKAGDQGLTGEALSLCGVTSANAITYPNPADGGLYVYPVRVNETVGSVSRGRMRGLWGCGHDRDSFNNGETFSGTGDLAGRSFEIIKQTHPGSTAVSYSVIETSDTLETN